MTKYQRTIVKRVYEELTEEEFNELIKEEFERLEKEYTDKDKIESYIENHYSDVFIDEIMDIFNYFIEEQNYEETGRKFIKWCYNMINWHDELLYKDIKDEFLDEYEIIEE